jgi:beta-alanine--pyruvate transaminase
MRFLLGFHADCIAGLAPLGALAVVLQCRATAIPIVEAVQRQAAELDFAPSFQFAHPQGLRARLAHRPLAPGDLDHVFFTNSGSESVDTALKIALAYHRVRGEGTAHPADRPRARLSRRRLRRHLGRRHGQQPQVVRLAARRRRPPAAHLRPRATPSPRACRSMGRASRRRARAHRRPARRLHHRRRHRRAGGRLDGVCPPPKGYLERLRAICDKHGILLIFDEVITGFGRLGKAFAAERFGVSPT